MSACKGCGRKIVWGETSQGKKIPLEECGHGYQFDTQEYGDNTDMVIKVQSLFISHFLTCPQANKFSGSNKEK